MVQAMVTLGEHEDRILNIIKGKFGLRNKSDAVNFAIDRFEEELLEPELRPEYAKRLGRIIKGKYHSFESVDKLRKATSEK